MASQAGYPIFVDLAGRAVLLVGAGQVGLRKARGLVEAGARLTVVSLRFAEGFAALAGIEAIVGPYQGGLIRREKWRLVFAAADIKEVNEAVQRDAAAAGVLCCRCDEQESGDFSGGAIGHIGGVTVAISTRGASPALSRRIREQALAAIDPVLATLAELLEGWRAVAKERVADAAARRALLLRLSGEEMEACLRSGGQPGATALFQRWLTETLQGGARTPQSPITRSDTSKGGN